MATAMKAPRAQMLASISSSRRLTSMRQSRSQRQALRRKILQTENPASAAFGATASKERGRRRSGPSIS